MIFAALTFAGIFASLNREDVRRGKVLNKS